MLYHMLENGYLTMAIPLSIFGYALTEETRPHFSFWKLLFYFMTSITLTKFAINLLASSNIIEKDVSRGKEMGRWSSEIFNN